MLKEFDTLGLSGFSYSTKRNSTFVFKKTFSLLFIILFFSLNLFAQRIISGNVTEIIDGRTIIIEASANQKYTVQLQYIEIPETEQSLSAAVKEHIEKLLLNKLVSVKLIQLVQDKWIGKIFFGDVDVSQQMLRDGAAWYDLPAGNFQNQNERENYQAMESAAKSEKRGVWSVEGLKPSWEFRAEKELRKNQQLEVEPKNVDERTSNSEIKTKRRNVARLDQFDVEQKRKNADVLIAENTSNRPDEKNKIYEALDEMREFLRAISEEGLTYKEFTTKYYAIRGKVNLATENLPKGKLRILMEENVQTLYDLGVMWEAFRIDGVDFVYYRYKVQDFARTYSIEPVRNKSGDFIITKQMVINALGQKVASNYVEIRKTVIEQYKSN